MKRELCSTGGSGRGGGREESQINTSTKGLNSKNSVKVLKYVCPISDLISLIRTKFDLIHDSKIRSFHEKIQGLVHLLTLMVIHSRGDSCQDRASNNTEFKLMPWT